MNFDVQAILQSISAAVASWGLKVIGAVIVLVVGRMIAKWARGVVRRILERGSTDATLVPFLSSLVYYLLFAFVVIATLGMVGIQTASIVAVLGAAGLAVGLALQGTLSHLAAGVMLLVFRPFQVDDFIEAGGTSGSVKSIGLFSTVLFTPDNVKITVPNGEIFGGTIKNYSANDTRRIDLVVGIDYGDDISVAMKTVNDVLTNEDRVLSDPAPTVAVSELGDSSVNLVVRPWCKREDYWALRWDLTRTFKERIEAAGCSFPFPQRDVHLFQESKAS